MRRAMDLIRHVVKDGVQNSVDSPHYIETDDLEIERSTVYVCMKRLQNLLELCRVSLGKRTFLNNVKKVAMLLCF